MSGIFISYRRSSSKHLARLIFQELRSRGYDTFLDVSAIDSGEFDRIILNQVAARPHFLLILSPGSLERCVNEDDWLRREIEEAFRLQRNIVPIFDEGFNIEQEKQYLPESIRDELPRLNAPPYSHYYFEAFMDTMCNRFLKQAVYDVTIMPTPTVERDEVQRRIEQAAHTAQIPAPPTKPIRGKIYDLLLPPFEWIHIPRGSVTLLEEYFDRVYFGAKGSQKTFDLPAFAIAKYPVTHAQFLQFIEADGYKQRRWWTETGWQLKEKEEWRVPEKINIGNSKDDPIVGVSWYEAIAFCLWLSEVSGESITLLTEQQWQRAAQGDDSRLYPWGNDWDNKRCNNSVLPNSSSTLTSVARYAGQAKGDSPSGVTDMAGNVWEWTLTDFDTGEADYQKEASKRVLRGGSWSSNHPLSFRVTSRFISEPRTRGNNAGFRIGLFPIT